MIYFKLSEFDSPDEIGSGLKMDKDFLLMIDNARGLADIFFIINSGYRTVDHNKKVKGSPTSSHLLGRACDIHCVNPAYRLIIVAALLAAGFTRIGIYETFIHVDNDNKPDAIWL